jgi:glycosyltransferase involved in cell wall biosynthesis
LGKGFVGVIVIDDGSSDETAARAATAGALVVRHDENRGKGAALRTGMTKALELAAEVAVSVDADGQHPPDQALALALHEASPQALVLGVRDLVRAGAPRANRFSNRFSNRVLSLFSGRTLADTQCGLRRYPLGRTLALEPRSSGYEFESEVILRACAEGWEIVEYPVEVYYPPEDLRVSHFRVVRDPARIVARVLHTVIFRPSTRAAL